MKFRESFLTGRQSFDAIFDLTDEWSQSDEPCTLREYLGLTAQEEDVWISKSDEALEELLTYEKGLRLFFTDLDGTLLTDDKRVSERTDRLLRQALKAGHKIVLATGRSLAGTLALAKHLGLAAKGCYLICCNGAVIYDPGQDTLLHREEISPELVRLCFAEAEQAGVYLQTYLGDQIVAQQDSPYLEAYCRIQGMTSVVVEDAASYLPADEPAPKLLAMDQDHEKLEAFRQRIEAGCNKSLDLFFSQDTYLEIVPHGVNKGAAVRIVAEKLQFPLALCVAAGDAENDLSMLQVAGIGAAMRNGAERVRAEADYVTALDNNHDGAAEILERFVLNQS